MTQNLSSTPPACQTLHFVIAIFDGVLPSAVAGMKDLLGFVNLVQSWQPRIESNTQQEIPTLKILTASPDGKPITDGQGGTLKADAALLSLHRCSAIIIPGFMPDQRGHPPP